MKRFHIILLMTVILSLLTSSPLLAATKFGDVSDSAWYADFVYDLVRQGIINGKTETTFDPGGNITRAEFAKILAYASGEDLSSYENQKTFSDVPTGKWYTSSVNWAKEHGVVNGVDALHFAPNEKITREQMAAMICRFADDARLYLPEPNSIVRFKDSGSVSAYAVDAIALMQRAGIINGFPDGSFGPKQNATRAQAAKMISVFLAVSMNRGAADNETFKAFMAKDVGDFKEENVINFDDDTEDNFAVVQDDVTLINDGGDQTVTVAEDEANGTYVLGNIDESVKNLKKGDKLMITADEFENCAAVIVDSIDINGDEAVITAGSAEVGDFFEYIQVDAELTPTEDQIDLAESDESVTFLGVENETAEPAALSTAAVPSGSKSGSLKVKIFKFKIGLESPSGHFGVYDTVTLQPSVSFNVNYDIKLFGKSYLQCDAKASFLAENEATLEANVKLSDVAPLELGLCEFDMPLGPSGLIAEVKVFASFDLSGTFKGVLDTSISYTQGFHYDTKNGFTANRNCTAQNDLKITAEGKATLGLGASVGVSLCKVVSASVAGSAGVEAKCVTDLTGGEKHSCYICIDGQLYKFFETKCGVKVGFGRASLKAERTLLRVESLINDFYCSQRKPGEMPTFGWGDCPYKNATGEEKKEDETEKDDTGGDSDGGNDANIVDQGDLGSGITWKFDRGGTLTVSGKGEMTTFFDSGDAPWYVHKNEIKKVVLSKGLTNVGNYAFTDLSNVTAATLPEGITDIGKYAFAGCESLTSVDLPESLNRIEKWAFASCVSLTEIKIPKNVAIIEDYVFSDSWNENENSGLQNITVAADNKTYSSENGVLFNKDKTKLLRCPPGKTGSCTVPNTVQIIEKSAFGDCRFLTKITLPQGLTTIGNGAFDDCERLAEISIPASTTKIGATAFQSCVALKEITLPACVSYLSDSLFYWSGMKKITILAPNVTYFGSYLFEGCRDLTIYGHAGSNIETYAKENGIPFKAIK